MDEFCERVELSIMSKASSQVTLKSLSLKPNVLNTGHKKIKRAHESTEVQDECKEMNEERLLETLSNDILKKVKKAARSCNVFTVGSKIDIIMQIKATIFTDDSYKNFLKYLGSLRWLVDVFLSTWSCVLP